MRQDSASAVADALMSAGGLAVRRGLRGPWGALIAAAVVIVLAGGAVVGVKAFASSGTHDTATGAVTGGTSKALAKGQRTSASSAGVSTVSGADGSTATTHYDAFDDLSSGYLSPAGKTAVIPYFKPVKGEWDWLGDVQRCKVIGSDRTTEGVICLGLLEGNSGGGITWYTPGLTAYCETISTGDDVKCAKVTGDFGMYSATGVQEAPKEYGWLIIHMAPCAAQAETTSSTPTDPRG